LKYISLCENHLFTKVYRTGNKFARRSITLYVLSDRHAGLLKKQNPLKEKINRVGFAVPKKPLGAVGRNRVKRILREAYRRLEKEHNVAKGKLIVVSAAPCAISLKTGDIYAELVSAAKKAGII